MAAKLFKPMLAAKPKTGDVMQSFESIYEDRGTCPLPTFSGMRIMMMPVRIGDVGSIPESMTAYTACFQTFSAAAPQHEGHVGYLTIDEKLVVAATTHRRGGLHVDGGRNRSWGGGPIWGGGKESTGMLTVASHAGCRAWRQVFTGEPGEEGSCEHLRDQLMCEGTVFKPGQLYWCDGMCVHESVPQQQSVQRQFVRLALPSTAAWYDGYTANPLGVLPTGPILPRRRYMDAN